MSDDVAPEPDPSDGDPADGAGDHAALPDGDLPTGEPDAAMVDDAVAAAVEDPDEPAADEHATHERATDERATDESAAPLDPQPATEGPVDDGTDPAADRIETTLATVLAGVDAVHARVDELGAGLQGSVEELVRLTRRADDHVAELHGENQRLRAGELAGATLPLLRDVVRLHDEVEQLATAAAPEAQDDLALVRSRLLDTLSRWGLSSFAPEVGAALDATRHNGVGAVPSSDGEAGTIAAVRRVGFAHDDGRTFRAADVEVFRAPPPPPSTDEPED